MPSKDWVKCEGEKGIYKRKKKDEPNKYDYLLVYHLGYTEEFDEKTGKNRRKENQSQKVFPSLKEAKAFQGSIQSGKHTKGTRKGTANCKRQQTPIFLRMLSRILRCSYDCMDEAECRTQQFLRQETGCVFYQ